MGVNTTLVVIFPTEPPAGIEDILSHLREQGQTSALDYQNVWGIDGKIGGSQGVEQIKEKVFALPWDDYLRRVGIDIHAVWVDDYTMEDDSMGGRISPYASHHELWELR